MRENLKHSSISKSRNKKSLLPSTLIGGLSFAGVVGFQTLPPWNISWLLNGVNGDMLQAYIGWNFFRKDKWRMPLGDNPNWGLEISNSIVYTDSIPLLALPMKLFNPLFSGSFQYFGLWLFLCFILQSVFAWKLISLYSDNIVTLYSGTLLFVFSPIMLNRSNLHLALTGHFLLLSTLYFTLNKSLKLAKLKWFLLILASLLVHAYLFLIVCFFYTLFLKKEFQASRNLFRILPSFLSTTVAVLFVAYLAGYFVVRPNSDYGPRFGIFRWNLASPGNPDGWSVFLQGIINREGNGEGFSYLGAGVLLLLVSSTLISFQKLPDIISILQRNKSLAIVSGLLAVLAASHEVAIANFRFSIPLPESVVDFLSIFRASGRLIWIVIYLMIIFLIHQLQRHLNLKWFLGIMLCAAIFQIIDTSDGWRDLFNRDSKPRTVLINQSPIWSQLRKHYSTIRVVPESNEYPHAIQIGLIASQLNMRTNAVYVARADILEVKKSASETMSELQNSVGNEGILYILTTQQLEKYRGKSSSNEMTIISLDGLNLVLNSSYLHNTILTRN